MIQAMTKGAVFGGAEVLCHSLMKHVSFLGKDAKEILSGGLAGFGQGLALSPLLLLKVERKKKETRWLVILVVLSFFRKTRVMTDPSMREVSRSPWQQIVEGSKLGARVVLQREIFKGSIVFASKRFADWTTR